MTTKIRCIAIDDEPVALDILKDYANKVPFLDLIGMYRNALQALDFMKNTKVELIFLDINMPDLNGIQFVKSLRFKPRIIFTTAYPEFAVESYDLEALDYLLKPIEFDRFLKAVNKINSSNVPEINLSDNRINNFLVLKSGTKSYMVDYSDILFIEGSGNYLTFHTTHTKIMVLMNMSDASNMLPGSVFVRIHKSFIVSLKHINIIENHQVQINENKIPVGSYYKESFLKKLNNFNK